MSDFVSFVIPAYNEENNIASVIKSIHYGKLPYEYEIIVVNHNSSDKTREIAAALATKVIDKKGGTIASVRNLGVNNSKGNILVFLDADVTLSTQWFSAFSDVVKMLHKESRIITGSHCNAPDNGNWIERYWFNNYTHELKSTNLGTGHMIISRAFFDEIGGFDESLYTGEDYAFCMSAINLRGRIFNNPKLRVVHHDYPTNEIDFIKREIWHGRGDAVSIYSIFKSRVAIAAMTFMVLHIIIGIITIYNNSYLISVIPVAGIIGLMSISSWIKFRYCKINVILVNAVIFYLYYIGRSISLFWLFNKKRS